MMVLCRTLQAVQDMVCARRKCSALLLLLLAGSSGLRAQAEGPHPVSDSRIGSKIHVQAAVEDRWLAADKAKHFLASALLTGAAHWIMHYRLDRRVSLSRSAGAAFAFSLGLAKEVRDLYSRKHYFSWKDLLADCLGIIAGGLLLTW